LPPSPIAAPVIATPTSPPRSPFRTTLSAIPPSDTEPAEVSSFTSSIASTSAPTSPARPLNPLPPVSSPSRSTPVVQPLGEDNRLPPLPPLPQTLPILPGQPAIDHHIILAVEEHHVDLELSDLYHQCLTALGLCWRYIAPGFGIGIFFCYILGTLTVSQSLASIGVSYFVLLLLIMGSYAAVMLPFVLLSHIVASYIVPPQSPQQTQRDTEFYVRTIMFFVIVASALVCLAVYRLDALSS
jgi:hypothetical protein